MRKIWAISIFYFVSCISAGDHDFHLECFGNEIHVKVKGRRFSSILLYMIYPALSVKISLVCFGIQVEPQKVGSGIQPNIFCAAPCPYYKYEKSFFFLLHLVTKYHISNCETPRSDRKITMLIKRHTCIRI